MLAKTLSKSVVGPLLARTSRSISFLQSKKMFHTSAFSMMDSKDAAAAVAKAAAHDTTFKTSVIVSIKDKPGALIDVVRPFKEHCVNISKIESKPSKSPSWDYDFYMIFDGHKQDEKVQKLLEHLRRECHTMTLLGSISEPWFPRRISDLDRYASRQLEYGASLDADHPGFSDEAYRKRRTEIVDFAKKHKYGEELPYIQYRPEEVETWGTVYNKLMQLVPTHACQEYQYILPLLQEQCGYSPDRIPQIRDISSFLSKCTGFQMRPVSGLLTSRDFLNGLAFRVFHSTQYIRHHSKPLYTPEPDLCHELIGHVPLFADPDFADFSQEIGLASLGASEEEISKLATLYWFTVEFGITRQAGELRAYGAGLLSSFGELEYCLSDKPEHRPFDPFVTCQQTYPITEYQPVYFVVESFSKMTEQIRDYASKMGRPFSVKYNPFAHKVEVVDHPNMAA